MPQHAAFRITKSAGLRGLALLVGLALVPRVLERVVPWAQAPRSLTIEGEHIAPYLDLAVVLQTTANEPLKGYVWTLEESRRLTRRTANPVNVPPESWRLGPWFLGEDPLPTHVWFVESLDGEVPVVPDELGVPGDERLEHLVRRSAEFERDGVRARWWPIEGR